MSEATATYNTDLIRIEFRDNPMDELDSLRGKIAELELGIRQAYFWTDKWQKGELAADKDIKAGRTKRFSNPKDAIAYLRS